MGQVFCEKNCSPVELYYHTETPDGMSIMWRPWNFVNCFLLYLLQNRYLMFAGSAYLVAGHWYATWLRWCRLPRMGDCTGMAVCGRRFGVHSHHGNRCCFPKSRKCVRSKHNFLLLLGSLHVTNKQTIVLFKVAFLLKWLEYVFNCTVKSRELSLRPISLCSLLMRHFICWCCPGWHRNGGANDKKHTLTFKKCLTFITTRNEQSCRKDGTSMLCFYFYQPKRAGWKLCVTWKWCSFP